MKEYLSTAGEMLDDNPEITFWNSIKVKEKKMNTKNKTVIGLLEHIAQSIGGSSSWDIPSGAYGDKQGREEVLIRYTVGTGVFGPVKGKEQLPISALDCAMYKMDGERDGTFEGVWQPQIPPEKMIERPEQPKDPLNKPEGPFPDTYMGAFTKAIWTFGDGSAIIGIGPASLQLVPFKDGSHIFLVSVAGIIANGKGKYENARGVKTALGATYIPPGVNMFELPPGQKFDAVTIETFRIIKAEFQG